MASKRRRLRWIAIGTGGIALVAACLAVGATLVLRNLAADLPDPPAIGDVATSPVVLDRNERLLRSFTIDDGRWRLPIEKADVDPRFLEMLIGYEDRRFESHSGVDYKALARAAGQFVLAGGEVVSGGSTLTMQVARLIEGGSTRDAGAKLRQIAMAEKLEAIYSKDEILTLYLMLAPYGGNIEGIRAASLAYFGKEPSRLTIAEAALLVALPQSPEARRPDRHPEAAQAARDRVLDRLVQAGTLTRADAADARRDRVPTERRLFPMLAAHRAEAAVAQDPEKPVHNLTIDRDIQSALEDLARQRVEVLGPKLSIAILAADTRSGDILASVGSAELLDSDRNGHVDMTFVIRSPGSTLKPLIYGLAFEEGLAHPSTLIEDRPIGFGAYAPQNFDGEFRGTVTVRQALADSLNIPAIKVLDEVGPARLVGRMKRAGIRPELPRLSAPGLAVGLGGVGVSLRELVHLYAAMARGGSAVTLHDGATEPDSAKVSSLPVLSRTAAWQVADILADVLPPSNGSPGTVAYKTGTSYGYRDAWAVGFDGRHVIGVWIGRPDGTPVPGLSGISGAAPILFEAFSRVTPNRTPLPRPPGGVLMASTSELPPPLRRFRTDSDPTGAANDLPQIAFPQSGVSIDLGIKAGDPMPLAIKVRNGAPPFTFFANGAPIGRQPFQRSERWEPDGPGFVTLSVVDAAGHSDRVTVYVE